MDTVELGPLKLSYSENHGYLFVEGRFLGEIDPEKWEALTELAAKQERLGRLLSVVERIGQGEPHIALNEAKNQKQDCAYMARTALEVYDGSAHDA